jgi:hypothetical protein
MAIFADIRTGLLTHLRYEPKKVSRSRVKRLRGLRQPQYRLRLGEIRIFHDVTDTTVQVLAIVTKPEADWFEYRLENDPRFLRRIEQARDSLHAGRGLNLEDVETD